MKKKQQGFTLIELLVVITIVMILGTLGFVSYGYASANARNAKRKSDIEQLRSVLEMYRADTGYYPDNGPTTEFTALSSGTNPGQALLDGGYIASLPADPKDNATHPYKILMSDNRGTPEHYYGYCISAYTEGIGALNNACGIVLPQVPVVYTYGVKNP